MRRIRPRRWSSATIVRMSSSFRGWSGWPSKMPNTSILLCCSCRTGTTIRGSNSPQLPCARRMSLSPTLRSGRSETPTNQIFPLSTFWVIQNRQLQEESAFSIEEYGQLPQRPDLEKREGCWPFGLQDVGVCKGQQKAELFDSIS